MIQTTPKVRWHRVTTSALILVALVVAVALLPFARDGLRTLIADMCVDSDGPVLPSDDDFAAIVLAIVAEGRHEFGTPRAPEAVGAADRVGRAPVLLSDASITVCIGKRQTSGDPDSVQVVTSDCRSVLDDAILTWSGADLRISRDLRMQLARANREPVAVPVLEWPLVRTESEAAIDAAIGDGGRAWPGFYTQFPETAGYIRVSRPVLSPDRMWAAIALEHHCGGLCGFGAIYLLMRDATGWVVVLSDGLWVS